ncbi:MAG: 4Fe-4S dicluster domain-containing protein [Candidatus Neomarinimicrobiota bacterium]
MSSYFKNIGIAFITLWDGMRVTMHHFVRKRKLNVTLQYPHEKWPIPNRHIGFDEGKYNVIRSRLHVDIDDCIGCLQCERACPVDCIKIDTVKLPRDLERGSLPSSTQTSRTSHGSVKRFLVARFDIDMSECMYCNLCTYPCPEECIYMVGGPNGYKHPIDYEFAQRDRNALIYQFATATDEELEHISRLAGVPNPRKELEERRIQYHQIVAGIAVEPVGVTQSKAGAGIQQPEEETAPAKVPTAPAAKPVPSPEKAVGEEEVDLSILDGISDRLARGKAKSILNRALRQGASIEEAVREIRTTLSELGKLDSETEAVLSRLVN